MFFFFSSRRRHTRFDCDWSSDVCSSDLYGGRRFAVMAGVFVVALIFFYQYVQGLDMLPGFYPDALLALGPWAGFLILTGYVVGGLAEQREVRLATGKNASMATLELPTYHLASAQRHRPGPS